MNDVKPWWKSKTIIASAVAIAATAASFFGFDVDAGTQSTITDGVLQIVAVVASFFAIFGRVTARHEIN